MSLVESDGQAGWKRRSLIAVDTVMPSALGLTQGSQSKCDFGMFSVITGSILEIDVHLRIVGGGRGDILHFWAFTGFCIDDTESVKTG